jgi:conjugal transfer pilus assembly protein TraF
VNRIYRTLALLAPLLWTVLACAQSGSGADPSAAPSGEDPVPNYWLRKQEGWFWYRDPPTPPKAQAPAKREADRRPKELVEFEVMQKRLEELKRIAVMNPTEAHMKAYMGYQRYVMDKSAVFADTWQRVVWKTPELDYSLTGRPTNSFAIDVYDGQIRGKQADAIRALAKTHGLFFFFRSDCPYCHKFAPVLKRFEQEYGLNVFPVSLDGGGLPDYPSALLDNGIATNLNVSVVPAVFLAVPGSREITPIGYGLMAATELVERIYAVTQTKAGDRF